MSLLLSEGHVAARRYPVAVAWSETRIVRERQARQAQENAVVMHTVIASLFSEKGGKALKELLDGMSDVG